MHSYKKIKIGSATIIPNNVTVPFRFPFHITQKFWEPQRKAGKMWQNLDQLIWMCLKKDFYGSENAII